MKNNIGNKKKGFEGSTLKHNVNIDSFMTNLRKRWGKVERCDVSAANKKELYDEKMRDAHDWEGI